MIVKVPVPDPVATTVEPGAEKPAKLIRVTVVPGATGVMVMMNEFPIVKVSKPDTGRLVEPGAAVVEGVKPFVAMNASPVEASSLLTVNGSTSKYAIPEVVVVVVVQPGPQLPQASPLVQGPHPVPEPSLIQGTL